MNWGICSSVSLLWQGRTYEGQRGKEVAYDAVEFGPLVALRPAGRVLVLACAKLPEVLGGSGHDVLEELEGYSAKWFTCDGQLCFTGV